MRDEGSLGDAVVDVTDGDRYIKTPREWRSVNFGPMCKIVDDQIIRDAGIVATGKFRDDAIKRACADLLATMRATGATSCHYENGDLCNGWAK